MKLFIVESPKKCKTINKYLDGAYTISATMGHIRSIPAKGLNVDVKNGFEPNFAVERSKKGTAKEIKSLADKATEIILATDPDREGEAISWHVTEIIGKKNAAKCKRITFHEIKKNAILKALKSPRDVDMNLVSAQQARQVLDRLIGYKVSPILWRAIASKTSAGRVQSIALKLICERQKEIDKFKPETFWYLDANLKTPKIDKLTARVITKDKENRFKDEKKVQTVKKDLDNATYKVGKVENTSKNVNPPPPFDTTSLQKACSSLFDWNLTKTMKVAQHLYESGKTTYIRTDSYSISKEAIAEVRAFIPKWVGKEYLPTKPNYFKKKSTAAAQEAHECIRPTVIDECGADLSNDDEKMYDLIRFRFLACQSTPMIIDQTTITIDTNKKHKLVAKGQTVRFDGWSRFFEHRHTEENILPDVNKSDILGLLGLKLTKGETKPPPRFNDGTVTDKMEKEGVGRPSTRASILKALEDKGYVQKDKKAFVPTELGMRINDYLNPKFDDFFMDIKYTARIESDLDLIAQGKKGYLDVVSQVYEVLKEKTKECSDDRKEVQHTGQTCPACKEGEIIERDGRYGSFFACDQYPECKAVFELNSDGKYVVKKKKTQKKTGCKCSICGKGEIVLRDGRFGDFYACNAYPICKTVFVKEGDQFVTKR